MSGAEDTLLGHLLAVAGKHPEKVALRCGTEALTYGEFRTRILAAAAHLRALGVARADRIIIAVNNTLAMPVLYFAVHALGAVAAPVPPDTPESAIASLAIDAGARLAVMEKPVGLFCPVLTPASVIVAVAASKQAEPVCRLDAVADLLYTTGTTGRKKGVVLTQANILAAARNITSFVGSGPEDVEVVPLPLSHSFGLGRLRCLALTGNTLVLEPGLGTGAPLIKRILTMQATGLALVPAGFDIIRRMTGDALGKAKDHLRYIEIGSAPMKAESRQWLTQLLPHTRICHHYGLTEASRAAFTEYHSDAHKPGTVGRAAPNVRIAICDETGLRQMPAGETGEVVVHGGMVMREYWKQSELTAEAFCSEGLRTGDIGYLDAEGYLFLTGRRSDMINVGGRKVAPDEIENLLCQLEGVRDAGCVGEPDELLGERVKVYLVADREIGRAEVAAFLRSRVEESKIPQAVERIASIPRTSSGKIQRRMLRVPKETVWTSEG